MSSLFIGPLAPNPIASRAAGTRAPEVMRFVIRTETPIKNAAVAIGFSAMNTPVYEHRISTVGRRSIRPVLTYIGKRLLNPAHHLFQEIPPLAVMFRASFHDVTD